MAGEYQFDLANNVIDPAALQPPVRAIVHCGWDTKPTSLKEARRINVDGTQWLFDQCRKANIKQFVFISSLRRACRDTIGLRTDQWETEQKLLSQWELSQFSTVIAPGLVIGNGGCFARVRSAVKHRGHLPNFERDRQAVAAHRIHRRFVQRDPLAIGKGVTGRLSIADPQGMSAGFLPRAWNIGGNQTHAGAAARPRAIAGQCIRQFGAK